MHRTSARTLIRVLYVQGIARFRAVRVDAQQDSEADYYLRRPLDRARSRDSCLPKSDRDRPEQVRPVVISDSALLWLLLSLDSNNDDDEEFGLDGEGCYTVRTAL